MMILYDAEPFEVCMLKKQLANITCKCSVCEKLHISRSCQEELKEGHKKTQAGSLLNLLDHYSRNDYVFSTNLEFLSDHVSCPGCYIALNILKARERIVFKDEQTETIVDFPGCDKASGKCVRFIERTTSTLSVITSAKNSSTSFCEKVTNRTALSGIMKKRSNEHVTFKDNLVKDVSGVSKQHTQEFCYDGFCLQNFMDSISPPMANS